MSLTESNRKDRFSLLLLEPGEIYFEDFAVYYYPPGLSESEAMRRKQKGRLKVCSKSLIFDSTDFSYPILKFPLKDCTDISRWRGSLMSKLDSKENVIMVECEQVIEMLGGNRISPYVTKKYSEAHLFGLIYAKFDDCLPQILQLHRASTLLIAEQATMFPVLKVKLSSVKRIVKKRFLLRQIGLELFCSESATLPYLFFSLDTQEDRDILYCKLLEQPALQLVNEEPENMTLKWQNGIISNYDYLLYLNSVADRSFNDLTQYPVFPWVIADYTSSTLDLANPSTYRDLLKPIGALNEERLKKLKERYKEMASPKFLYGSHYSTPGFVLYYLVRKDPQYMLCLQNGRFDHPDRMFNSVKDTWRNITSNSSDFKELIPEFYQPENKGDFLNNSSNLDFGVRHTGVKVADVELPPWAKDPSDFIQKMRDALESDIVSCKLHHWIDLIFGYKQQGEEAEKADNVFYFMTYEGAIDLDKITDINERYSMEVQITEFGQVPKQIFKYAHPQRYRNDSEILFQYIKPKSKEDMTKILIEAKESKKVNLDFKIKSTYQLHKGAIPRLQFSNDGRQLFSVGLDSLLKIYSVEEAKQERSINISNLALSSLAVLPDGKNIILGSWDNNMYIYNIEFGKIVSTTFAHDDAISDLCYNDGMIATASWDSTAKIWNCICNGVKQNLSTELIVNFDHETRVHCVALNSTNSILLSGTDDGQVYLWDLNSFTILSQQTVFISAVNEVAFSPDDQRFICCGNDLRMFDFRTQTQLFNKDVGQEIKSVKWNGSTLLTGDALGNLMVWDLVTAQLQKSHAAHEGSLLCIDLYKDELIATGGEDKRIIIWER